MKHFYKFAPLLVFLCLIMSQKTISAQDTLVVEWLDESDDLLENSLYNTIVGDTVDGGERANLNRVYKLKQGGFYYVEERIENSGWHLNIVGEPGDPSDEFSNPPVIQLDPRVDGTTTNKILSAGGDVTFKNVILNGKATNGNLQYEVLRSDGVNARLTFDNVVFEFAQWGIMGVYGSGSKIYITNSRFRNLLSQTQPWGGRGFSVWADADTVYVENNSFVNIGGFGMQMEASSPKFVWINQNTFANVGRQMVLGSWMQDAFITNNLVLNGFWQGEARSEISDDRLEAGSGEEFGGMFAIDDLPAEYGLNSQRNIAIANNSFFLESTYETYFTTDNDTFDIRKQPLLNVKTQALFDGNQNMVVQDNFFDSENPGFEEYPDNNTERINFITDVRQGNSPVRLHYWSGSGRDFSDHFSIEWPLSEDLTYSNTTLKTAAIGGYPLGDLNWYPSEKATWEANQEAQKMAIRDLLGEPVVIEFQGTVEAESGTTGGSSEVGAVEAENRRIVRVESSGDILWDDVNVDAGTYDVLVSKRTWYADESNGRTTDLVINSGASTGIQIGENQDGVSWTQVTATGIEFTSGTDSVTLKKNWGFMEYQYVSILEAGTSTEVLRLWPGEADLVNGTGASFRCPDGGTCLSGDKFVDTKTGGDVTINFDSPGAGNYTFRTGYVLTGGSQTLDITLNGGTAQTVSLTASDSTFAEVDLDNLSFNQGSNELVISASSGGVLLDRFDFFSVGDLMTVSNDEEIFGPNAYKLSQNYPNPFNPTTNINFTIPASSDVELTIYNLLGQKVSTLLNTKMNAGTHTINFDASNLASGIYLYRLKAGDKVMNKRMTLIK